jgi:hypothetical protein
MTLDPTAVGNLVTLIGAVVAALVALWNAVQNSKLVKKVDEQGEQLKALSRRTGV